MKVLLFPNSFVHVHSLVTLDVTAAFTALDFDCVTHDRDLGDTKVTPYDKCDIFTSPEKLHNVHEC